MKKLKMTTLKIIRSWIGLRIGLMFRYINYNSVFLFDLGEEKKAPFHTIGVLFPIHIIWFDAKFRRVDIAENVRPFLLHTKSPLARYVVEVRANKLPKPLNKVKSDVIPKGLYMSIGNILLS